mmetsp:Transcript_18597/g.52277  ORF Transcript_18597/g.52277 Transcript_18597/m.52277 type:complete len:265 (+) Transcript_18597:107-901(+)|eukprot:CAMPEP_0202383130 /NCGR_PEP_ID=MMETSP1127-20130417/47284_1 /ASSEMBLY_ACC=CAM_ASM_000462 /TAXON_ID=3047 /ORGANISM="Dunaliella tertiolecta, Strain CCMP1320" /LENGTH=264 /DNA_ID=CAMNT_0048982533 /DNA_START=118 /DNA_END=912 /DNA_ORIENTATION=+
MLSSKVLLLLLPISAILLKQFLPQLLQSVCQQHSKGQKGERIHDVSMSLRPGSTLFARPEGLDASFRELIAEIPKGDNYYMSFLRMEAHTGTHIDSPAHFTEYHMTHKDGVTIEKIDLDVLIGPAYVLEIPTGVMNITDAVLQELHIPKNCERLLLKTDNSRNQLLQKPFTPDYSALTSDGSRYLAQKTNVKSVGIDSLSIATSTDNVGGHVELFHKDRVIIPIEGLLLEDIEPGRWYDMTCLPIKLQGAEGSPARCVLMGPTA